MGVETVHRQMKFGCLGVLGDQDAQVRRQIGFGAGVTNTGMGNTLLRPTP
jgi:hypothetical protein